jgi:hypothetical protein
MLLEIKKFFFCGRINIDNRKTSKMKFVITKVGDIIEKLIPHFDNHPLNRSKFLNYNNFKLIGFLMKNMYHRHPQRG